MIASLLTKETLILDNVPRLADVALLQRILNNHGVDIMMNGKRPGDTAYQGQTLNISAADIIDTTAPYELVSKMRASFWVLAPLLARMGEAKVSLPGGCAIGTRPVDLLIFALQQLGAEIEIDGGYVIAARRGRLARRRHRVSEGHRRRHPYRDDGGFARQRHHRDRERRARARDRRRRRLPQQDGREDFRRRHLAHHHRGRAKLSGARHSVLPDRIETGTYAMAVAMAGGDIMLENTRADLLQSALDVLAQAGAVVTPTNRASASRATARAWRPVDVTTAPFPGFPTDLQAQFMALMTRAQGTSHITETIFENRFMHVQELARLGARIHLDGETATIEGVDRLKGAPVMATDLRASVSLVIAALAAEGETIVNRVYHLDRGFERSRKSSAAAAPRSSGFQDKVKPRPIRPQRAAHAIASSARAATRA